MARIVILPQRIVLPLLLFGGIVFDSFTGRIAGPAALGKRLKQAFERLQVTYLKLGQYLAIRADLLPRELCRELEALFDEVAPLELSVVEQVIASELGQPADEVFAEFAPEPIAAASIAQVHRATLRDGRSVAVKVQRPGIREIFAADMRLIRLLARLIDLSGILPLVRLTRAAAEFETFTSREMDFRQEAATATRIRAMRLPGCVIPAIVYQLSTSRVLVMDYIHGISLAQIVRAYAGDEAPDFSPEFIRRALTNLARVSLRQLYVEGFFHADPHPGNVLILPDGRVGLIDFGIFGELTPMQTQRMRAYVSALVRADFATSAWHLVRVYRTHERSDIEGAQRDIARVLAGWHAAWSTPGTPPEQRQIGRFLGQIIEVMKQRRIEMSTDTLLFWRSMTVLNASTSRMRGDYDLLGAMRDFFSELARARVQTLTSPAARAIQATSLLASAERLAQIASAEDATRVGAVLTRRHDGTVRDAMLLTCVGALAIAAVALWPQSAAAWSIAAAALLVVLVPAFWKRAQ
jgi:ubiquinone biosynthesis protein